MPDGEEIKPCHKPVPSTVFRAGSELSRRMAGLNIFEIDSLLCSSQ